MRRIRVSVLVVFLSLCTAVSFAQHATTSLRGVVKDPSGAVVRGATITLVNDAAGQKLTTTSKQDGEYALEQILPAKYTITVTAPGFGAQTKTAELLVDEPASGLDRITASEIDDLLMKVKTERHTTMVIVTHDIQGARKIADKFAVLDQSRLLAFGAPEELDRRDDKRLQQFIAERCIIA